MNASRSGTQNGSARIAGSRPCSWSPFSLPRVAPGIAANASSRPASWPGASTNEGSSWTRERSSTAGGAGSPALERGDATLRGVADPAAAAAARRSGATSRSSAAGSCPRRPRGPPRGAPAGGARVADAARTPERSPARRPRSCPCQVVARSSQVSTRGSSIGASSCASDLGDARRVALHRGQRDRRGGTVAHREAGRARERASERRVRGGDQDPGAAAPVATQLDVVGERLLGLPPSRRSVSSTSAWRASSVRRSRGVCAGDRADEPARRRRRAAPARGRSPAGCTRRGARAARPRGPPPWSVAKLNHHDWSGRARSSTHSSRRRLARRRSSARSSASLTSHRIAARSRTAGVRASARSGSSGTRQTRSSGSQRRPGIARSSWRRRSSNGKRRTASPSRSEAMNVAGISGVS